MRFKLGEMVPHGDEGTGYRNADLGRSIAPEHCGGSECALLCKDEGQLAASPVLGS
jgi:hypothetical protein